MKLCNEGRDRWSLGINQYCPDYRNSDFMYGDWYTDKYSYMQLKIHYCHNDTNSQCETKENIDEYFRKTIVGLKLVKKTPNFKSYENLFTYSEVYVDYDVRTDGDYKNANEIFYSLNNIELSDDKIGIFDYEDEHSYLSWATGLQFQKPVD